MTREEFCEGIASRGSDAGIRITIENLKRPPGHRPLASMVKRSDWFNELGEDDQRMLTEVIREAAESTAFGIMAILDGARFIEDTPEKVEFELYYVAGGQRVLLNDKRATPLHDLYNVFGQQR